MRANKFFVCVMIISMLAMWVSAPYVVDWYLVSSFNPVPTLPPPAEPSSASVSEWYARRGQVGDLFGAINSLFSGLALGGVAYGLVLQIDHRKREMQPEVYPKLASGLGQAVILNPVPGTKNGTVKIRVTLPIALANESGGPALEARVFAEYCGEQAFIDLRQPLLVGYDRVWHGTLEVTVVGSKFRSMATPSLGNVVVSATYSNREKVFWRTTAQFGISCRSQEERNRLQKWIDEADSPDLDRGPMDLDPADAAWEVTEVPRPWYVRERVTALWQRIKAGWSKP